MKNRHQKFIQMGAFLNKEIKNLKIAWSAQFLRGGVDKRFSQIEDQEVFIVFCKEHMIL